MEDPAPASQANASTPVLSVVMPVHNALPHLDEAVESILGQTFGDFEFVILDDASTDGSKERLRYWAARDSRIRLLEAELNLGPVRSSNKVANAARAPIVARMDGDDVSHPERFEAQLELLRGHPDVGVVASLCDMIDGSGRKMRELEIWRLLRRSPFVPFAHGAMMYRRELFERIGGYREECEYWEDQDLVIRLAGVTKIAVIRSALLKVRHWAARTRVTCEQEPLELALGRVYEVTDQLVKGQQYDQLFDGRSGRPGKVDPRVFIAMGSVNLWAGGRPRLFRSLLRRARISWNFNSMSALVWTAWASASPSSLRAFLTLVLKTRNRLAAGRLRGENAVLWRPLESVSAMTKGEAKR